MKQGKAEQLHLLSCAQRSRNAGFSCCNVTPLPCSTLFAAIKDPEGGRGAFAWLWGRSFYFGPFGVGSFWKGKELLKGNAKEGLTESLHREL
jgi:hypothetical protein